LFIEAEGNIRIGGKEESLALKEKKEELSSLSAISIAQAADRKRHNHEIPSLDRPVGWTDLWNFHFLPS